MSDDWSTDGMEFISKSGLFASIQNSIREEKLKLTETELFYMQNPITGAIIEVHGSLWFDGEHLYSNS